MLVDGTFDSITNVNKLLFIIDDKEKRPNFLKEIFSKESDYTYLEKIYDSKNNGFVYHVKVFKINYDLFNVKN